MVQPGPVLEALAAQVSRENGPAADAIAVSFNLLFDATRARRYAGSTAPVPLQLRQREFVAFVHLRPNIAVHSLKSTAARHPILP